jgi:hypothetical protein
LASAKPQEWRNMCGHTRPEARALASLGDEVVDRLARHGLAALGYEEPRQLVLARGEVTFDGAKLVALDRLLG